MTIKPLRLSSVTLRRQQLIRACQVLGFGEVRGILVQDGDPNLEAGSLVADERLDKPQDLRPEIGLSDFELCQEWCRLFRCILAYLGINERSGGSHVRFQEAFCEGHLSA